MAVSRWKTNRERITRTFRMISGRKAVGEEIQDIRCNKKMGNLITFMTGVV